MTYINSIEKIQSLKIHIWTKPIFLCKQVCPNFFSSVETYFLPNDIQDNRALVLDKYTLYLSLNIYINLEIPESL